MFKSLRTDHEPRPDAIAVSAFSDAPVAVTMLPEVIEAIRRREWQGCAGQILEAFPQNGPRVFVVGLGARSEVCTDSMRLAGAALARRCSDTQVSNLHIDFDHEVGLAENGQALGEAFGMAGWSSALFKGTAQDQGVGITISCLQDNFDSGFRRGIALSRSVNFARTLANTPPNIATPKWMADQAVALANATGLKVQVIPYDELEKHKLEGIRTVGQASANKPCFVRLEYRPAGSSDRPLVLIGKTLTFDSGGLSMKDPTGMVGMKHDKCGGCAVLGAMHALATVIKPKVPVVALLSIAENSVSSNAFRPDDVITYMNGKTVEITNTDAEGRLVLADALCWAYSKEKPQVVIDLATLTGGVVTALGNVRAGLFCEDGALCSSLFECGEKSGDRLWHLPLDREYDEMMKSSVADIVNSSPKRIAHPVTGAVFLRHFTDRSAPWAHLDIAGVAASDSDGLIFSKGATGFGVRLLARLIEGKSAEAN